MGHALTAADRPRRTGREMNEQADHSTLHADPNAPAFARSEVVVGAPIEVVWKVLTAIDAWPSWNHDVKAVAIDGELKVGAEFRWKAGPGTIISTIRRLEAPRSIAWTGRTPGVDAIHEWNLESYGGQTRLVTAESWDGLFAKLFRKSSRKALEKALHDTANYLKVEAERLAGESN